MRYLRFTCIGLAIVLLGFVSFVLHETKDVIDADLGNISEILQDIHDETEIAGFGVAVFTDDRILYADGFGFADVQNRVPYSSTTLQYIASVSKTTIGLALLKAQEQGLLNVEDPINRHLPFRVANPRFPDREITIRQLATHTSSLDYNEAVVESLYAGDRPVDPSLKGFMEDYFERRSYGDVSFTEHAPGEHWDYSNIGAALAAYIVEHKSGMPFSEFTQTYIFDPLDLEETRWFESPSVGSTHSLYYESGETGVVAVETSGVVLFPARDLISNVEELARYGQAVLSRGAELLSSESYDLLLEPSLPSTVSGRTVDDSGLFWMIDRNQYGVTYRLTGMNGGDYCINTMLWFDPVRGVGYVFLGNTGASESNRVSHIRIFRALASLGDNILMRDPHSSLGEKARLKWNNLFSRVAGLF